MSRISWERTHSILFVPAETKRLQKIPHLNADAYIIDLEDSIKDTLKEQAYSELKQFLKKYVSGAQIMLRINPDRIDREAALFYKELSINCIVIPKVEHREDVLKTSRYFPEKDIFALIETPLGLVNLKEIVEIPYTSSIGFGAEDYCARTGIEKRRDILIPICSTLVTYSKAYDKPV